ncbi:MAG: hypothetical protein IT262_09650 [Saprospiraceae bacterium]|nr:hypothetical protein [Saprospiraceae bacterium]
MHELVDLIDFIQKTKFKSNTLLDSLIKPDSQMGKIYHAIAEDLAQTDEDLLRQFPEFGSLAKVTVLKTRLKNRLCEAVFLLDFREESFPDRQTAFVECIKKWSAAMILISKNIRNVGVKQLENLLRHTLDFEFTELSMNIIRTLELYYATIEGDQRKYTELEVELKELEAIWLMEREVERMYSDLMINYVNTRGDKHLAAQKATEYFARVEPFMQQYAAFKIHFFGYLIKTIIHDSGNEFEAMEKTCLDAVAFFDQKKYRSGMVLQTFYYNLIMCSLYTRQFNKGRPFVQRMEELLEENSFNWFKVQELYFMMAMHTANYQVAFETLIKVQRNPYITAQPPHILEIWKLYEAYVQFLILSGELKETRDGFDQMNYKISRFLNEVPLLSKDKRGMNIPVLIIQFLFYVAQHRQDECESRMDALKKYSGRYLNDETTQRSRYFIKLLLQIPGTAFHLGRTLDKTGETFRLLLDKPLNTVIQHMEIEIIPYEVLWPIVLRSLNRPSVAGPDAATESPLLSAWNRSQTLLMRSAGAV